MLTTLGNDLENKAVYVGLFSLLHLPSDQSEADRGCVCECVFTCVCVFAYVFVCMCVWYTVKS